MFGFSTLRLWMTCALIGAGLGTGAAFETENEPFPGYDTLCGFPLITASTPSVAQAHIDRNGQPVIILDPTLQETAEQYRRVFLIAHECAHHRMGHAVKREQRKRRLLPKLVRDHELSADCWAAETLARVGKDRTLRVMEDRFFRGGLYSPGGGYPAGVQRATIIRECARIGRSGSAAQQER